VLLCASRFSFLMLVATFARFVQHSREKKRITTTSHREVVVFFADFGLSALTRRGFAPSTLNPILDIVTQATYNAPNLSTESSSPVGDISLPLIGES
jgi:hypothetical protein